MKHRWTLLLFAAPVFFLLMSMQMPVPQPNPNDLKVDISTTEDLRVQLTAQNETGKKLYINVLMLETNIDRRVSETEIYSETIDGEVSEINRMLNLSKLESGTYLIRIKAGKSRFERELDIRTKPAVLTDLSRVILIK